MRRVLVAPLNWGLGHATRCIPLIRHMITQGHEVVLASDGRAGALLQQEFPECPYYELPGYDVTYPQEHMLLYWLRRIPHLYQRIQAENDALQEIASVAKIDRVISDNRYGIWHRSIRSIILTHQLTIPIPRMRSFTAPVLARLINKFQTCWVPDAAPPHDLTGTLSANRFIKIPVQRIGRLSRFKCHARKEDIYCTAVVSGPEPDRSRFEQLLRQHLQSLSAPTYLVSGRISGGRNSSNSQSQLTTLHSPTADELESILSRSKFVVCRSGYSSIMDLLALTKPAILVPTPRQPEQLYLAAQLKHHQLFDIQSEETLNLKTFKMEGRIIEPDKEVLDFKPHLSAFLD
ncbi:MAG: hypothetical protein KTR24_07830 [Saprospiraceae bacterium]|nr:hypothetical protein [Saprospiraceae bacterium]